MVAIVTGNGVGLGKSSSEVLGQGGQLGLGQLPGAAGNAYVNAATGNLIIQRQDELLIGRGPDIGVYQTYNSQGTFDFDNNDNWQVSLYRQLSGLTGTINTAGSTITRTAADGTPLVYSYDSTAGSATLGKYVNKDGAGSYDTLTYTSGTNTWAWQDGNTRIKESYAVDPTDSTKWRITSVTDLDNNSLTYTYSSTAGLTTLIDKVTSANGEITQLIYNSSKQLTQINVINSSSVTTTRIRYTYESTATTARLTSVSTDLTPADGSIADGKTYTTTYTYDGTSKRIASITNSDGSKVSFTYEQTGTNRLLTISDYVTNSSTSNNTTTLNYTSATTTTVTNTNNAGTSLVTTLTYDTNKQLTNVQGPSGSGQNTSYTYNTNGDITQVTDNRGNWTKYTYDAQGNQLTQQDNLGNTVVRTYDSTATGFNQLLTQTVYTGLDGTPGDATIVGTGTAQTTRYTYDSNNHVRFTISAEGRVTEYRYNANGQLTSTHQYTDNLNTSTGNQTEAQMNTWLTAAVKSKSQRTDYLYDARGQLSETVVYTKVNATTGNEGAGIADGTQMRTQYVYDQSGNLKQKIDARGVATTGIANDYLTSYSYDGLNRLTLTKQYDQSGLETNTVSTQVTYTDASRQVKLTLANGLVTTSTYDLAGRLISVQKSDSVNTTAGSLGTTSYAYDKLNNLRMVTDPAGQNTYYLYDSANRKVGEIDPNKNLTEWVYNNNGQVIRTIQYKNPVTATLDASTALTNTLATAGVRPTADATNDRTSYRIYDQAGRLSHEIDALGYVTESQYDGASRLLRTLEYNTVISAANLALIQSSTTDVYGINGSIKGISGIATTNTLTLTTDATNDRANRNLYDNDGKLVGSLDAEGYLTEYIYDKAGRQLQKVRYATVTTSTNWAAGDLATLRGNATAVSADTPRHQATNYIYNAAGQLTGVVDAENYLTIYQYDLAGNQAVITRYANKVVGTLQPNTLPQILVGAGAGNYVISSVEDQYILKEYENNNRLAAMMSTNASYVGILIQYDYDNVGNLIGTHHAEISNGMGSGERPEYRQFDSRGNLIAELNTTGSLLLEHLEDPTQAQIDTIWNTYGTRYSYDSAGRLISKMEPNGVDGVGNKTLYYYDNEGKLTYTINALGEVSQTVYNSFDQVAETRRYNTRIASATLSGLTGGADSAVASAITAINSGGYSSVQVGYDKRGQLISTTDELTNVNSRSYNAFGELNNRTDKIDGSTNLLTSYQYDRKGLLKTTTEDSAGINRITSALYDAFGRVTQATDGRNNLTKYSYDRLGRTVTTTDALNQNTTATYDAFDRKVSLLDARGNTTSWSYNTTNRTMTMTTPENISVVTTRNAFGEVVQVADGRGSITSYQYNTDGQLTQTVEDSGSGKLNITTSTTYDKAGRVYQSTDAKGTITQYSYDPTSRVLSKTIDPTSVSPSGLNLTTNYRYDAQGRQIWSQGAKGVWTRMDYDAKGQLTKVVTDPANIPTTNASGVVTGTTANAAGLNLTTSYTYNARGNKLTVIEGDGTTSARTTQYVYDKLGRLTSSVIDPGTDKINLTTSYTYDKNDNVVLKTDANNNKTVYTYDANDRLVYTVDPLGYIIKNDYDANGNISTKTAYATPLAAAALASLQASVSASAQSNAAVAISPTTSVTDQITQYGYDKDNRLVNETLGYGSANAVTTHYDYDANGNQLKVTVGYNLATPSDLSNARITQQVFDAANRKTAAIDALGSRTETTYDATDNITSIKDALGNLGYYYYDAAGRSVLQVNPDGAVTQNSYDALGNLTQSLRYANRIQTIGTATLGTATIPQIVSTAPASGNSVYVLSDANKDEKQTTAYDSLNRKLNIKTWIGATSSNVATDYYSESFSYDALGNALSTTARNGATTTYSYDAAGRKLTEVLPVTARNAANNGNIAVSNTFTYDAFGNLKTKVEAVGAFNSRTTTYSYDALNRQTQESGQSFTTYNPLTQADSTLTPVKGKSYDARGNIVSETDANNNKTYYFYDNLDRRSGMVSADGVYTQYGYDLVGNKTSQTIYANKLQTLGSASLAGGNTVQVVSTAPTSGNVLYVLSDSNNDRTVYYSYDKMGRETGTEVRNVTYGALNSSLQYVVANGAITTSKTYDALGNVSKQVDANGNVTRTYYRASGEKVAFIDALGYLTRWEYDNYGNVAKQTRFAKKISEASSPLVVTDATTRDQVIATADLLKAATDLNDRVTNYSYDKLNRVISETVEGVQSAPSLISTANATKPSTVTLGNGTMTKSGGTNNTWGDAEVYSNQAMTDSAYVSATAGQVNLHGMFGLNSDPLTDKNYTSLDYAWFTKADGTLEIYESNVQAINPVTSTTSFGTYTATDELAIMYSGSTITYLKNGKVMRTVVAAPSATDVATASNRTFYFDSSFYSTGFTLNNVKFGKPPANTVYEYDGLNNVVLKRDGTGAVTKWTFDGIGRKTGQINPGYVDAVGTAVNPSTTYEYNGLGDVVRELRRGKDNTASSSTLSGQVETDDQITTYNYDLGGRLISETDAMSAVTAYRYDVAGNITKKTLQNRLNANGVATNDVTEVTYDSLNRQIKTQDIGTGVISEVQYNSFGEIVGKRTYTGSAPSGWQEFANYDNAGRNWKNNSDSGITKVFMYDANGNSTLTINGTLDMTNMTLNQVLAQQAQDSFDEKARQTNYTFSRYDARNQRIGTIQPSMDSTIDVVGIQQVAGNSNNADSVFIPSAASTSPITTGNTNTIAAGATGIGVDNITWLSSPSGTYKSFYQNVTVNLPNDLGLGDGDVTITVDIYTTGSHKGRGDGWHTGQIIINGKQKSATIAIWSGFGNATSSGTPYGGSIYYAPAVTSMSITITKASTGVAGSSLVLSQNWVPVPVSVYVPEVRGQYNMVTSPAHYETRYAMPSSGTSAVPKKIYFTGQPYVPGDAAKTATNFQLSYRTAGSTGAYTVVSVPQMVNTNNPPTAMGGMFAFDYSGLATGNYEYQFTALNSSNVTLNSQTGTFSIPAGGTPTVMMNPPGTSNAIGSVVFTATAGTGGSPAGLQLKDQGVNAASVSLRYRVKNSGTVFSTIASSSFVPGSTTSGYGVGSFALPTANLSVFANSKTYDVVFDVRDSGGNIIRSIRGDLTVDASGNKNMGTLSYSANVRFSQPVNAAYVNVSYRTVGSTGAYSAPVRVNTLSANSGAFEWNAQALVPDPALTYDYDVLIQAMDSNGVELKRTQANLRVGFNTVTTLTNNAAAAAQIIRITPPPASVIPQLSSDGTSAGKAYTVANNEPVYPGHTSGEFRNNGAFAVIKENGSVVTWGNASSGGDSSAVAAKLNGSVKVVQIYSSQNAFVALREDGSVVTWGDAATGGDSSAVANQLNGAVKVTQVYSTQGAFAAIRADGSVVTWGGTNAGGDSSGVTSQLNSANKVVKIYTSQFAFSALRADGSVITWGLATHGGNSSSVASQINGTNKVTQIYSTGYAFAALRADGSVVTWGAADSGNSSAIASQLNGSNKVVQVFSNTRAFAALRADGSVITWGSAATGGDSNSVASQLNGNNAVVKVYASQNSFAALRADGSVVTWGSATLGGDSSAIASQINGTNKVTKIFATDSAFAALRADGSVVTWGSASLGGDSNSVSSQMNGTLKVTQIYANSSAFAALREDGAVVTWGLSGAGGNSSTVASAINGTIKVTDVDTTGSAFSALRADGSVITWGDSTNGGNSTSVASQISSGVATVADIYTDTFVETNNANVVNSSTTTTIVASSNARGDSLNSTSGEYKNNGAFAVIKADGSVVTWGSSNHGGDSSAVATQLNGAVKVVQIYSTLAAFAALRADGSVVTWGRNTYGGDSGLVASQLNGTIKVSQIYSTGNAFAALRADGSVVTWGDPTYGGDSSAISTQINGTNKVTKIYSNGESFAALRADGSVVTWGDSMYGGNSSAVSTQLNGTNKVIEISSAEFSFAALRADGSVVTWGSASLGGDSSAVANQLNGSIKVTRIYSNSQGAFAALRADGSVITWGNSDGGSNSSAVSAQINGTVKVTEIYSTLQAFAALRADGSVVTWGVGPNSGADSSAVASQLNGTNKVVQISSNQDSFAALRADGSVITWGGSAGNSTSVAAQLNGSVKVTKIYAATLAFAALRADGSVITWGSSSNGGDSSSVSTQLNGVIKVTQMYSTSGAFAALRADGSTVTWGEAARGGDSSAVASKLTSGVVAAADIYTDLAVKMESFKVSDTELQSPERSNSEQRNAFAFAVIKNDGSVVAWGDPANGGDISLVADRLNGTIKVKQIYSARSAFAALREDGSVVTWGSTSGGDSSAVVNQLNGTIKVIKIYSTNGAFAALREDGSVVTWGSQELGGNSSTVANQLNGTNKVTQIYSTGYAFTALRADGSIVVWGLADSGGNVSPVASRLNAATKVKQVYSTTLAFAALLDDGSVITWGLANSGGDSSSVASQINGTNKVTQIYSSGSAFAALREDGSVITWGSSNSGGNSTQAKFNTSTSAWQYTSVANQLNGSVRVTKIFTGGGAFAALREDGSIVTWGQIYDDVSYQSVANQFSTTNKVKQIIVGTTAFAAVREDGSVVTWGYSSQGGDSSAVASKINGTIKVTQVSTNGQSFAALREDGSVVTWGDFLIGGSSSVTTYHTVNNVVYWDTTSIANQLDGNVKVTQIYNSENAFVAIREDGSTVAWGMAASPSSNNGIANTSKVANMLTSGVVTAADIATDTIVARLASVRIKEPVNTQYIKVRYRPFGSTADYTTTYISPTRLGLFEWKVPLDGTDYDIKVEAFDSTNTVIDQFQVGRLQIRDNNGVVSVKPIQEVEYLDMGYRLKGSNSNYTPIATTKYNNNGVVEFRAELPTGTNALAAGDYEYQYTSYAADKPNPLATNILFSEGFGDPTHQFTVSNDSTGKITFPNLGASTGVATLTTAAAATTSYPQMLGPKVDFAPNVLFKGEMTTDASTTVTGRYFMFGLAGTDSGNNARRYAAFIDGTTLKVNELNNATSTDTVLSSTVKASTTYVVEIVTAAAGATIYVYEKGQTRDQGFTKSISSGAWRDMQVLGLTRLSSGAAATSLSLDNITISESQTVSAAQSPVRTALGGGNGVFTVASAGTTTDNKHLDWVINTTSSTSKMIYRQQSYNAFGEVISETDGRGNVTDLEYNTQGKLTKKLNPMADFTLANGYVQSGVRTATEYTYDAAGRLTTVKDANGNINKQVWLAGAPPESQDMLTFERHADGGVKTYGFDIFGNKAYETDEANRRTDYTYDKENQLTRVDRPQRVNGSVGYIATRTYDTYTYDAAGQRISHTNSLGNTDQTFYDSLGRVTKTSTALGTTLGYSTNYTYTYSNAITGLGGVIGSGWIKTTTQSDGMSLIDKSDMFDHVTWHQDLGGHQFTYNYNRAGWLMSQTGSTGQDIAYTHYGNGYIQSIHDKALGMYTYYEYDYDGNRTFEGYISLKNPVSVLSGAKDYYQYASITYDAQNRMTSVLDPKANISYEYDAVGNRRRVRSYYHDGVNGTQRTQEYWYTYDSMNRFTTTMGSLALSSNGTATTTRGSSATDTSVIINKGAAGGAGVAISYNQAGERVQAANASDGTTESYTYTADGYLIDVNINGLLRSRRVNDALGRVANYTEYATNGSVTYNKGTNYDADNRVTSESGTDGSTTYYYAANGGDLARTQNINSGTTINTYYGYEYWDDAKVSAIQAQAYNPAVKKNNRIWKPGYSDITYDVNGHISGAVDWVGNRHFTYVNDSNGQILVRDEITGARDRVAYRTKAYQDPGSVASKITRYYYADGKRVGDISNDGPSRTDYVQAMANRGSAKGNYANWKPVESADFDQNYEPVSPTYPGMVASTYTVKSGDTLQSIARAVWGDSAMWYLIADANGLTSSSTLTAGQVLTIPNKVTNIHNNAGTFRPYNPGEAIGDTSPTLPVAPSPPKKKKSCGGLGAIIAAVVSVVVTVITGNPVAGNIAGQLVGMATGAQKGFNFTSLAMAAANIGPFDAGAGGLQGALNAAGNAAVNNVASQGLNILSGQQKSFSWSSVAVSAVGGAVGNYVGGKVSNALPAVTNGSANLTNNLLTGAVSNIASNVVSQLTQVALDGKGKLSWTSVAVSGIYGLGSGYESYKKLEAQIADQKVKQGATAPKPNGEDSAKRLAEANLAYAANNAPIGGMLSRPISQGGLSASNSPSPYPLPPEMGGLRNTYFDNGLTSVDDLNAIQAGGLRVTTYGVPNNVTPSQGIPLSRSIPNRVKNQTELVNADNSLNNSSPSKINQSPNVIASNSIKEAITPITTFYARIFASAATTIAAIAPVPESIAARRKLLEFGLGLGDGKPEVFEANSREVLELRAGETGKYYRKLENAAIKYMSEAYNGKVPNGATVQNFAPKSLDYSRLDGLKGFKDGIDLGDTIGTFSSGIKAEVKNNIVYFEATNKMTAASFFGENLLNHGLVSPINSGPAADTIQIFKWEVPLPKEYQTYETVPVRWK